MPNSFIFSIKNNPLRLPDSLNGKHKTGLFVVEVYVNRSASIVKHEVITVRIDTNGQGAVNYQRTAGVEPDSMVKPFFPYIADRVKDNIVLKPNPNRIDKDSLVAMWFVMRFN